MKTITVIYLLLTGLLFPFIGRPESCAGDTTKVIVLSLNDQHAKIDNYNRLKALVDNIKSQNQNVLLLAAGDNFTGNPIVDMYPDKGSPIIDLMNMVGFSATAVGNHEFDYGQDILLKRMQQAKFPFLNANIIDHTAKLKLKPYKIFTLENGVKVVVISAIQLGSNGLPDSHPDNLQNLSFKDGLSTIKEYKTLRDSCDIFIALTHLGFETDIELAREVPELNLIMGGHSHTLTKPAFIQDSVVIMQAGSNVRNLSKATFYLINGKIVKIIPEMLSITSYPESDTVIERKLAIYNDNKELNRQIGINLTDISGSDELGSMMTDAVTSLKGVDFCFQNNGGIRIDHLKKGPITVNDIYKLDPFGNEIVLFKMKADEIKSLILNAYKEAGNEIDLQASGMVYTILSDKEGTALDVQMKTTKGGKIRKNKSYNVGINSYIASSYKFNHKDPGRSLFKTTAQTLIDFINNQKEVNYQGIKRAYKKVIDVD
ncbi:MAG TPA: bifunctional UDP-sugar hydrolase/5'-nucleotidase [Lentimicrobium sp.]|nr:bifunctional UDP-sugar hydrolase/5'-nucleotidase [Lentimicrobium sp.]